MRRRSGVTLLEVVVASAVLSAVMAVTLGVLLDSSRSAERMSRRGDLENRGVQLVTFSKALLLTGKYYGPGPAVGGNASLGLTSSYTELRFQVPVSRDASDGMVYGFTSSVGVDDPAGAGAASILRFEADSLLLESAQAQLAVSQPGVSWGAPFPPLPALSVITLNLDLNGDGDRSDSFLKGKIRRYAVSAAGALLSQETLSDDVILEAVPGSSTYPYSMADPATGVREPLFRFVDAGGVLVPGTSPGATGRAIVLTVWHGTWDQLGNEFPLRKCTEVIRFRNAQQ